MGVLPLQVSRGHIRAIAWARWLGEVFDHGIVRLDQTRPTGHAEDRKHEWRRRTLPVQLRIETPIEIDYYRHGGILPFVLRQLLMKQ